MPTPALDTLCPAQVHRLIEVFAAAGEIAYLVGGCVRDALMGKTPHDWDIAVTCAPERTEAICQTAGYRTIPTGIAHGTVTVLAPGADGEENRQQTYLPVECTTCRTEGSYSDGRHPDTVRFTGCIQDDLSRRDFTINAMAASLDADGHFDVIDLFGGREDLQNRTLRCVGNSVTRFTEDALRILRAVRFAVQLECTPDASLVQAVADTAQGLHRISRERVCVEFSKILCSAHPTRGVTLLTEWGLMPYVLPPGIPPMSAQAPAPDLEALPPELSLRLAALLWRQPLTLAQQQLQDLRLPKKVQHAVMACLEPHAAMPSLPVPTPEAARRLRAAWGEMTLPALQVRMACTPREDRETLRGLHDMMTYVYQSIARGDAVSLAELAVTGRDLIQQGFSSSGRETGRLLQALLEEVLMDPQKNVYDKLIKQAQEWVCSSHSS